MQQNVQFHKVVDTSSVVRFVSGAIQAELSKGHIVVWFVSGGSNIPLSVDIRDSLNLTEVSGRLHVCMIDERYGPVGHENSNWKQLTALGFNTAHCDIHPILNGAPIQETAQSYNALISEFLRLDAYKIGMFGIGADAHTAGLLPNNPCMDSPGLYDHYNGNDFQRITATPQLMPKLDSAILYASGENKNRALQRMFSEETKLEVPAKILLDAPELHIFTEHELKETV